MSIRYLLLCCSIFVWSVDAMEYSPKSIQPTEDFSFTFNKIKKDSYQLTISTAYDQLLVDFTPLSSCSPEDGPFYYYVLSCLKAQAIVDLWPLNGSYHSTIEQLFSLKNRKELSTQIKEASTLTSSQTRLFVLDLKGENSQYLSLERIKKAEDRISDFLTSGSGRSSHNILRSHTINFFIREGLLKAALITRLCTKLWKALFDTPGEQGLQGRQWFCMFCELIMNGFKAGYAVTVHADTESYEFHPRDFFAYACPQTDFSTETISLDRLRSLPLYTLYPAYYNDIYGPTNKYFQSISRFFKADHRISKSYVTCISIESLNLTTSLKDT